MYELEESQYVKDSNIACERVTKTDCGPDAGTPLLQPVTYWMAV